MQLNRIIAFSDSWATHLKIALIIGVEIFLLLFLLQPFGTFESDVSFKALKLGPYGVIASLLILVLHFFERKWYQKRHYQWRLLDEVISMTLLCVLMSILSYLYHNYMFSDAHLSFSTFGLFSRYFALPFLPLVLSLLIYLRYTFGEIRLPVEPPDENAILIKGKNKEDEISLIPANFLYAQSLQNYVEIHYLDADGSLQKQVIRSTLGELLGQLPQAKQIHRSYLINLSYLQAVEGNQRKRFLSMQHVEASLPVSTKYYQSLQLALQNRP